MTYREITILFLSIPLMVSCGGKEMVTSYHDAVKAESIANTQILTSHLTHRSGQDSQALDVLKNNETAAALYIILQSERDNKMLQLITSAPSKIAKPTTEMDVMSTAVKVMSAPLLNMLQVVGIAKALSGSGEITNSYNKGSNNSAQGDQTISTTDSASKLTVNSVATNDSTSDPIVTDNSGDTLPSGTVDE